MSAARAEPSRRGLRSAPNERASKPRRTRSTTETLLSMVLLLETVLLFFVTLTVFGLKVLEPLLAFVGGAVFIVVLLLASRLLRYPWGVWLGWVLQVALLATGLLLPLMFLVAAGFVAFWVYCFVKARDIDRRRAAYEAALLAEQTAPEGPTPTPTSNPTSNPSPNPTPNPNQGESL